MPKASALFCLNNTTEWLACMGCEKNLKQGQIATIDDLLEQDFSAPKPNEKWVGDITYVWTDESWLYLAVVMDLYSRMVVICSIGDRRLTDGIMAS